MYYYTIKLEVIIKLIIALKHIPEEYGGLTDQIAKYIDLVKQNAKVEVGLLFEQDFIDYYNKPTYPCKFLWSTNNFYCKLQFSCWFQ